MIDDKKIEEAARRAADLYEQDLPSMSYEEDTEVDGQHHFCQEFGAELFKDGAKWAINEFLNGLWHPVSEKPKDNKVLLVQYHQLGRKDPWHIVLELGKITNWRDTVADFLILRWFYMEDLFPKKE